MSPPHERSESGPVRMWAHSGLSTSTRGVAGGAVEGLVVDVRPHRARRIGLLV